ncbi:hypothetical protein V1512DRAFT_263589 [Lipomyces arxii]|uniref:uncharacterized protein n=1 Tax=Lipomyces arxii TaxID=56418 RepID=UPI0034CFB416
MATFLRRFLFASPPSAVLLQMCKDTAQDASTGDSTADLDATLSEYEIITASDADILTSQACRTTIDVASSESTELGQQRSAVDEDYMNLNVRPLTYVEVLVNGLAQPGQSVKFNMSKSGSSASAGRNSRKFENKMFARGPDDWRNELAYEEDEDKYWFGDRKMCRGRERQKSLVMDRRARLRAMMV